MICVGAQAAIARRKRAEEEVRSRLGNAHFLQLSSNHRELLNSLAEEVSGRNGAGCKIHLPGSVERTEKVLTDFLLGDSDGKNDTQSSTSETAESDPKDNGAPETKSKARAVEAELLFKYYERFVNSIDELYSRRTTVNSLFLTIHSGLIGGMFLIAKEIAMPKELYWQCLPLLIAAPTIGIIMSFFWLIVSDYYGSQLRQRFRTVRTLEERLPLRVLMYEEIREEFPLLSSRKYCTPTRNLVFFGFPTLLIALYSVMAVCILAPPFFSPYLELGSIVAIPLLSYFFILRGIDKWEDQQYMSWASVILVIIIVFVFAQYPFYLKPGDSSNVSMKTLNAIWKCRMAQQHGINGEAERSDLVNWLSN